ncbi:hypothetical protein BS50DRAFT_665044 [Corynespora cassiicola Philippines]|uniref:Uncharacterized protein n=1 Tax=Corynespora cassiicola Philippines TaxID=1448308 RepID=A0A2T2NQQ1_CORCC|nr:hypothetical protein BS50DRAFT_665044 [Corynespora cassiicola Philippines]
MTGQESISIDDLRAWKIYERAPKLQVKKCKKSSSRWQFGYEVAQIRLNCYSWLCPDHSAPPDSVKYLIYNQLGYAAVDTEYDIENASVQIQKNSLKIQKINTLIRKNYDEGREEKEQAH